MEQQVIEEVLSRARKRFYVEVLERFKANKLAYFFSYVLGVFFIIAIIGPYIAPYDPYKIDLANARKPPSIEHPLGTDELGRDILSRILVGARYTLGISIVSVVIGALIGVFLGLLAGFYRGLIDNIIMRVVDVMLAFPTILLAIALATALGQGYVSLILSISITTFPVYTRLTRNVTLQVVEEDYVAASRLLGERSFHIMFRHILPNISSVIIVQATYYAGLAVLLVSSLGFLGLGIKPPIPEWGSMISSGRSYLFNAPHIALVPGIFISLTVLGFNIVGDGLRDALDPRSKKIL